MTSWHQRAEPPAVSSDEELSDWLDPEFDADAAADPQQMQAMGIDPRSTSIMIADIGYEGVAQPKGSRRRMSRRGSTSAIGAVDVDESVTMRTLVLSTKRARENADGLRLHVVIGGQERAERGRWGRQGLIGSPEVRVQQVAPCAMCGQ